MEIYIDYLSLQKNIQRVKELFPTHSEQQLKHAINYVQSTISEIKFSYSQGRVEELAHKLSSADLQQWYSELFVFLCGDGAGNDVQTRFFLLVQEQLDLSGIFKLLSGEMARRKMM